MPLPAIVLPVLQNYIARTLYQRLQLVPIPSLTLSRDAYGALVNAHERICRSGA